MQTIDLQAAQTQLSRLVDEAAAGSEIIIARAGKPIARLVPLEAPPPRTKRILGRLDGQVNVPDDFDHPLPADITDTFEAG